LFHQSSARMDEEGGELSAKDKKQQLKAKLKAAMAEKEKAEAEATDDKNEDPKAKLKAKLEAKKNEKGGSSSSSSDTKSSSGESDDKPKDDATASAAAATANAAAPASGPASTAAAASTTAATTQYSYPELTADAAKHKAGLSDPTRPSYQNPLHHNNPDLVSKVYEEDFASKEEFEKAVLPAPGLADADGNLPAPQHIQELADEMVNLTMLEYNELVNKMAEHFGFYDGQLGPDDTDGAGGDDEEEEAAAPAAEAKTAFDVKLVSFDAAAKIKIIKEIRTIVPGLGLKEAKALVESAPVMLQKGMSQEAADEVKKKLVELGAVVEIE
jgi:large subunit ribosomal protein L7/L12